MSVSEEEFENLIIIPPDGGWGWMVVFTSFVNHFVIDGNGYSFGLYIEVLSKEFNIGIAATSLIGAIMSATMCFAGPIVSALLNKYDFRCVAITGTCLAASAYALCSITTNHLVFLAAYGGMLGISYGMMFLPAIIIPNLYFAKWRALASGLGMSGSGMGSLVAPPVIEKLLEKLGWRKTFQILTGVVLITGLTNFTYKPLAPLKAVHKKHKKISYVYAKKEIETWLNKCGSCWKYSNKYYPTTNKIIPIKYAELTEADDMHSRRQSTTSQVTIRGRSVARSSVVSAYFTNRDLCKYNCLICLYSECCENETKPMYRDDIFFSNALHLIPKYQRHAYMMKKKMRVKEKYKQEQLHKKMQKNIDDSTDLMNKYHMEVTRVTMIREYLRQPWCQLPISIIRPLMTLLHLELFKSFAFNIQALSMFLFNIGNMIPYMYIIERAKNYEISSEISCWFLATVGGASTIGRLSSGIISSTFPFSTIIMMYVATFICGLFVLCSGLSMEIWYQFLFSAIFGFTTSFMIVLRPVLIVQLFGLENLTNIIGLQIMIAGIAASIGPPVAGLLYDLTRTYKYSFYLSGSCFILSAFLLTIIKQVRDWELKKSERNPDVALISSDLNLVLNQMVSNTEISMNQTRNQQTSSKQAPSQQTSSQQASSQQASSKQTSSQQAPSKQAPKKPIPKDISKK